MPGQAVCSSVNILSSEFGANPCLCGRCKQYSRFSLDQRIGQSLITGPVLRDGCAPIILYKGKKKKSETK